MFYTEYAIFKNGSQNKGIMTDLWNYIEEDSEVYEISSDREFTNYLEWESSYKRTYLGIIKNKFLLIVSIKVMELFLAQERDRQQVSEEVESDFALCKALVENKDDSIALSQLMDVLKIRDNPFYSSKVNQVETTSYHLSRFVLGSLDMSFDRHSHYRQFMIYLISGRSAVELIAKLEMIGKIMIDIIKSDRFLFI